MLHIDIDRLQSTPLVSAPFEHVVVPNFISADTIERVNETFPDIKSAGSYPIASLTGEMFVKQVIDDLGSPRFEQALEEKFNIKLAGLPKMYSLRGYARTRDGDIHTDSKDKVVTVLLYLNRFWPHATGRLRLLRSAKNLEDYAVEIPPDNGTLLVFKRSDHSWHGHHSYAGPRRALQMNWMTDEKRLGWHAFRHTVSAALKKMANA
jgi:SM-20-related protein